MLAAQRRRAAVTATLGLLAVSVLITLLVAFAPKVVWFAGLYIVLAVCAIPIWFLFYCGASSPTETEVVPYRFQVLRRLHPRPLRRSQPI
jgi:hypothetical protein